MKRRIAILGSTGSIGTQALEVIQCHPDLFGVEILTAKCNANRLIEQAIRFQPNAVVIGSKELYGEVKSALSAYDIKVFAGEESIAQVVESDSVDMVLTAMVGYSGLLPTINAIKAGKAIALANKETLVAAGELVTGLATENNVPLLPVDSEHSAIFQCLVGEQNPIEKIILTASGGPFREYSFKQLAHVTVADALRHPNWNMGNKITIDSATMMNKGFEVIEAKWLFGLKPEQIEVIIHPQSIVHSMVQFEDGSIKAQMGLPDMKLPIQYALSFPKRIKSNFPRFSFVGYPSLTFEPPDIHRFPMLQFAYEAMNKGGNIPCALNAANEVAVDAFLNGKLGFLQIADVVEESLGRATFIEHPTYDDYLSTDINTREIAIKQIGS
ncbi:MAG TPA: 1-deoxy-D-xylulose-5-phosphate reductoisomerase [Tenuifilaceae bacterium]|nr:1-deoxy-D-xylulose-5-phosphate reductoisomerase [Bacteroidales bacterium]MDI9517437.1 1-deoxy-D-xylulose-5-phosphate reductoisomerase [Bacteroidota bacterium]NLH56638.1 1-deoxy-D-xylulose-5-phosphate reductoisomerase [Rikenellaceae bacterium]HNV80226.1 1-deoxy-D-xylulose-5-phosphate reductoisomerase [Tenuifilaceae bacterium]MZP82024.1 1-deoxy-D-xylulose-5-phosphate reductoisomerase [Bacteroidales bacterium]